MDVTLDPTGAAAISNAFATIFTVVSHATEVNRQTMSAPMRDLNDAMQIQIWLDWRHFLEVIHVVEPAVFDFKALLDAARAAK